MISIHEQLKAVELEENTTPAYYCGGTLIVDHPTPQVSLVGYNTDGNCFWIENNKEHTGTVDEETLKIVARIYCKSKTKESAFYERCSKLIHG